MKKLFVTLVCATLALTASAQYASSSSSSFFSTEASDRPVTAGIRAGLNIANMSVSNDSYSLSPNSKTGFHIGMVVDIPLMQSLYIQPGLYYTTKGCKEKEADDDDYEITLNPSYLEMPILASYRYDFSDAAQLQVNFGPYFAFGLGGKVKEEEHYKNGRTSEDEYDFFGSKNDDSWGAKRFDMGLQVGAGITIAQHVYVGLAYEFGLMNLSRSSDASVKNNNLLISLGYQF